jgi:hypothetical protein
LSDDNREAKRDNQKAKAQGSSSNNTTNPLENSLYRSGARTSNRAAENLQKIDAQQQQQKRIGKQSKQVSNKKENADTSQNV